MVGILVLVYHNITIPVLVIRQHLWKLFQQAHRQYNDIIKIHCVGGLERRLVFLLSSAFGCQGRDSRRHLLSYKSHCKAVCLRSCPGPLFSSGGEKSRAFGANLPQNVVFYQIGRNGLSAHTQKTAVGTIPRPSHKRWPPMGSFGRPPSQYADGPLLLPQLACGYYTNLQP